MTVFICTYKMSQFYLSRFSDAVSCPPFLLVREIDNQELSMTPIDVFGPVEFFVSRELALSGKEDE